MLKAREGSLLLHCVHLFPRGSRHVYSVASTLAFPYRFMAGNSIIAMFQGYEIPLA